jgi:tyrosinase
VPFWSNKTTFYRSSSPAVRRWTDFGYDYPEFKGLANATQQQIKNAISAEVKRLYGPDGARASAKGDFTDWFARVRSQPHALGGSYSIFLFFGEPPQSPDDWRLAENLIGVDEIFANPIPEACADCTTNPNNLHEAIVGLTDALRARQKYAQGAEAIKSYIQSNLKWRIQKVRISPQYSVSTALMYLGVRLTGRLFLPISYLGSKSVWKQLI